MFMRYPLLAVMQMLWVMSCLQPAHVVVKLPNEQRIFVQSRGRSLFVVASAAGRWSSSVVTSLFFFLALRNRGARSILDASFQFAHASGLVFGQPWMTVRMEQRAFP